MSDQEANDHWSLKGKQSSRFLNEWNKNTISYIMYFASGLHISHICNLIDLNLTFDSFCFNHIITEQKQLSDSWFRKWLWYHWRRIAIQGAAEYKNFSFNDPYEWAWSVIESLPLVEIQTFGADLLERSKPWIQIHGAITNVERWQRLYSVHTNGFLQSQC
jgi:hypothetical protein